ncbi:succinate--CoA ligase subunit beta [Methanosphaerula palustris]|uniref:Succinyl-CoA synthetase, beta subunit n=1 Tax=Methanosphaerula palustris (strain ATCC BAA-1556 / DSM 19958 / E1-9c) TaxID=521011 RepID=B8GKV4_METPE|nr:ATP-grasp domain-containing protein [Methanosphaerula palustris]ACL17250.1 succinyl-CoA synthetase, beta subunit [Methanosphaerula palustris E1-9c]
MKLREYEAKRIFGAAGIQVPRGVVITSPEEITSVAMPADKVVLKAQVDVGGRGKAGGILLCPAAEATATATDLFGRTIKGLPVDQVLVEEQLPITHEYFLSIAIDRSTKQPILLFADAGGVDIEATAAASSDAIRRVNVPRLMTDLPAFVIRDLLGDAPKELGTVINTLWHVFNNKDALLAEINPLVTTTRGVYAADAKLIIDDNALWRQGITQNRDLTPREREAEQHGFSYVELDGSIGVVGNGAGLTMATLDLIEYYEGKAANFLDVGGGADQERVRFAVQLLAGAPQVQVIIVNLLGGITRCDEVARGIISAGVSQRVIVRMAGTNEAEGKALLAAHGYQMYESMDEAVAAAVEATR